LNHNEGGGQDKADFQSAGASRLSCCLHIVFAPYHGTKVALQNVRMVPLLFVSFVSKTKPALTAMCGVA
jgi:hypothetical protein